LEISAGIGYQHFAGTQKQRARCPRSQDFQWPRSPTIISIFVKIRDCPIGYIASPMNCRMPVVSGSQMGRVWARWISAMLVGLILICSANPGGFAVNNFADVAKCGTSEEPTKPANETADPFDEVAKCAQVRAHRSSREVADQLPAFEGSSHHDSRCLTAHGSWSGKSQPLPGTCAPRLPELQVWRI
jgi:hypothetical protein